MPKRRRRRGRHWLWIALAVAAAVVAGAWLAWRPAPAIPVTDRARAPESAPNAPRVPAPREEIREGERRALEKLLEEKSSRGD